MMRRRIGAHMAAGLPPPGAIRLDGLPWRPAARPQGGADTRHLRPAARIGDSP